MRKRSIGIRVSAALIAGATLGNLGSNLMPVLMPGMAHRLQLSHASSGMVATAQLLATALAALVLAPIAARPGRARVARLGLVAAVAGLSNIVAGAGLGMVSATAMAAIAATDDTDRAAVVTVLGATLLT
ncbi:hypothetical protein [Dactylosporangium sp. CA-233914]|uniref:hypothetical protein n=1 Tax=Dactylosporangium sp. CA-233914 TaxID=3239934 RepID=UPI003D8DF98D